MLHNEDEGEGAQRPVALLNPIASFPVASCPTREHYNSKVFGPVCFRVSDAAAAALVLDAVAVEAAAAVAVQRLLFLGTYAVGIAAAAVVAPAVVAAGIVDVEAVWILLPRAAFCVDTRQTRSGDLAGTQHAEENPP